MGKKPTTLARYKKSNAIYTLLSNYFIYIAGIKIIVSINIAENVAPNAIISSQ